MTTDPRNGAAENEKGDKRFVLRLPPALWAKLEARANSQYRSVNSLIVMTLARAVARWEKAEDTDENQTAEVYELAAEPALP